VCSEQVGDMGDPFDPYLTLPDRPQCAGEINVGLDVYWWQSVGELGE